MFKDNTAKTHTEEFLIEPEKTGSLAKYSAFAEESEIAMLIKNSDEKAFETLFYSYREKLSNFLRLSLPEENDIENLVQEIFVKIWLIRSDLNPDYGIQPLLFSIARNIIKDQLRKNLVRHKYLAGFADQQLIIDDSADKELIYVELEKRISDYINRLPERRKYIFHLSRMEGKSYKQIAEELEISVNTVDTQIRRTLNGIRKIIGSVILMY